MIKPIPKLTWIRKIAKTTPGKSFKFNLQADLKDTDPIARKYMPA